MPSQPFTFAGAHGHILAGKLELPEGPAHAYALLAHCFTCSKDSLAAVRVARALAAEGIAVLRFDFTGLGQSGGAFGEGGLSSDIADIVAAAGAMAGAGMAPALLVGHSFGGAAVLAAALQLPEVKAVATIAAPFDVEHVSSHFGEAVHDIRQDGAAQVTLGGRPFTIRRSFLDDLAAHDPAARLAALHRPLLILHGPRDAVVGIDQASALYKAALHPKSFVSLDSADHLLTDPADAAYAAAMIAAWATRYLPKQPAPAPASAEPGVVAELTGEGRFQTRISARGGAILADEPVEVGGLDSGPTPYELLGAALGACTAMTMRLYAERKGWELPALRVRVAHARLPENPPRDRFTREILFDIPVEPERRARLLEIADRCPVHRTLERASDVVTLASDAAPQEIATEPATQHVRDMDEAEPA